MTMLAADFTDCSAIPAIAAGAGPSAAPDTGLPDDARLYLRHVDGGETIRALARELNCHASTVLRRIRRFEARRDDPLVDRAVDRAVERTGGAVPEWTPAELAQARRVLRRMAEPGAILAVAEGMDKAIVSRDDIRIAILSRALAERLALMGWVALRGIGAHHPPHDHAGRTRGAEAHDGVARPHAAGRRRFHRRAAGRRQVRRPRHGRSAGRL